MGTAGPFGPDDDDDLAFPEESTVVVRSDYVRGAQEEDRDRRRFLLVRSDRTRLGEVLALTEKSYVAGRNAQCDLWLDGEGVSRKHAQFDRDPKGYTITDLKSANGTYVNGERVEKHPLADGDLVQVGPLVSFRYTVTDAQHEKTMRQLYEASVRDALTGAHNREYLGERLRSELAYAMRHRTELAVLLLDLDHFKKVNDTYGHPAGDAVLMAVSSAIKSRLRAEDVLARYGGEEFVVILRAGNIGEARVASERIRETIEALPIVFEGHRIPVTASIGCATISCAGQFAPEAMIAVADRRLYAAKNAGRNRVVWEG